MHQCCRGHQPVGHIGHHRGDGAGIGYIRREGQGAGAKLFGQGLGMGGAVAVIDGDVSAFTGKGTSDGGAKAAPCTGDQNGLVFDRV